MLLQKKHHCFFRLSFKAFSKTTTIKNLLTPFRELINSGYVRKLTFFLFLFFVKLREPNGRPVHDDVVAGATSSVAGDQLPCSVPCHLLISAKGS